MLRREPGNDPLKDPCMQRFLFGLALKKLTRSGILRQSGLGLCTIMGHPFPMFQKGEEPCDRYLFVRTDQHDSSPWVGYRLNSNRTRDTRYGTLIASDLEP